MANSNQPAMRNRSMPESPVIPVLRYSDVRAAVDWLTKAFGFTERLLIADHRAQLNAFGGTVVVADGPKMPEGESTHSVMIRVVDADRHCERAKAQGARIVNPPTTYPFGERQYTAIDPAGHAWTFSQTVADIDPASWGGKWISDE